MKEKNEDGFIVHNAGWAERQGARNKRSGTQAEKHQMATWGNFSRHTFSGMKFTSMALPAKMRPWNAGAAVKAPVRVLQKVKQTNKQNGANPQRLAEEGGGGGCP